MASDARQVLDYGRRPIRRSRWILLTLVLGLISAGIYWRNAIRKFSLIRYHTFNYWIEQRRALEHRVDEGLVALQSPPTTQPVETRLDKVYQAMRQSMVDLELAQGKISTFAAPIFSRPSSTLLIARRKTPDGREFVVCIRCMPNRLLAETWPIASPFSAPDSKVTFGGSVFNPMLPPRTQPLEYLTGAPDPASPSDMTLAVGRFGRRYELRMSLQNSLAMVVSGNGRFDNGESDRGQVQYSAVSPTHTFAIPTAARNIGFLWTGEPVFRTGTSLLIFNPVSETWREIPLRDFQPDKEGFAPVEISSGGKYLLWGGASVGWRVTDLRDGRQIVSHPPTTSTAYFALSDDLLLIQADGGLTEIDLPSGRTNRRAAEYIAPLMFGGRRIVRVPWEKPSLEGSRFTQAAIIDIDTRATVRNVEILKERRAISLSPDGAFFVEIDELGIRVTRISDGRLVLQAPLFPPLRVSVLWSPDSSLMAIQDLEGTTVWSAPRFDRCVRCKGNAVRFSADSGWLLGSGGSTAILTKMPARTSQVQESK
jgi:hypothetical protein